MFEYLKKDALFISLIGYKKYAKDMDIILKNISDRMFWFTIHKKIIDK